MWHYFIGFKKIISHDIMKRKSLGILTRGEQISVQFGLKMSKTELNITYFGFKPNQIEICIESN